MVNIASRKYLKHSTDREHSVQLNRPDAGTRLDIQGHDTVQTHYFVTFKASKSYFAIVGAALSWLFGLTVIAAVVVTRQWPNSIVAPSPLRVTIRLL